MKTRIFVVLYLGVILMHGQTIPNSSPKAPTQGTVTAQINVGEPVLSLDQLIRSADLIVDGSVITVLPSVNRNTAHPELIETPSLVGITTVLSGQPTGGAATVAVSQEGGTVGDLTVVVPEDPPLAVGQRYIFFLANDTRTVPPNTTGFTRYSVVGVWSGKARVNDGTISFLPSAVPRLHQLDNTVLSSFLTTLSARIALLTPQKAAVKQ